MRKTIIKTMVILASLIAIIGTVLSVNINFREYEIKEKYSISEIANTFVTLNDIEKANINRKLKSEISENDNLFGFKSDAVGTDLYFLNSLVEIAKTLNNAQTLKMLKDKTTILAQADPYSMSILNLIYYIDICEYFDINYIEEQVIASLEKFYDRQDKLFFLNNSKDTVNVKLAITALCCKTIPKILTEKRFEADVGIQSAYEKYKFSTAQSNTFYNSGGDIIYCYSILGCITDSILSKHREWFELWKSRYEATTINNIENALAYSEFYKIAIIFDKNYDNRKIQNFYNNLTKDDLPENIDFYLLSNCIKNSGCFNNNDLNLYIANKINVLIALKPLFEMDIDVVNTVYGVVLAKNTGYEIDKQKLQNYINQNYNKINSMKNTADIINNLYYMIILDELNNNYIMNKDSKYIQNIIDKSIKSITFNDDITNDIVIARKALEIVTDLQLHGVNVHINTYQIGKIRKGLAKAAINQNIINSVIITDLYIIDDIINADIISKDLFHRTYKTLTLDGGSKAVLEEDNYPADISTTYRFLICFDRMNNYSNLHEQQKYAKSLQLSDGIYRKNLLDNSHAGLESILFGNSITKLAVGGDKQ